MEEKPEPHPADSKTYQDSDWPPEMPGDANPIGNSKTTRQNIKKALSFTYYLTVVPARWCVRWLHVHDGLITALATVAIAYLTISLAADSKRQAGILGGQLAEMQAERRPWVSVDALVDEPFVYEYEPNGTNISLRYSLHNSGRSPANNVWIELVAFPFMPDGDIFGEAEKICRETPPAPGVRVVLGFTLFPNETITVEESSDITKAAIDSLSSKFQHTGPMTIWAPTIIACVVYRSPSEAGKQHHTPLILNLRMKPTSVKAGRGCCAIFIDDSPIAAADLNAERMIINLPAD